jgi:hypothetical protein
MILSFVATVAALLIASVAGTIVLIARDGYRRVPARRA